MVPLAELSVEEAHIFIANGIGDFAYAGVGIADHLRGAGQPLCLNQFFVRIPCVMLEKRCEVVRVHIEEAGSGFKCARLIVPFDKAEDRADGIALHNIVLLFHIFLIDVDQFAENQSHEAVDDIMAVNGRIVHLTEQLVKKQRQLPAVP